MIPDRIIKRIPGKPPPSVREKQGYIEDLCSLSRTELLDLIERQDKLIANKAFLRKLPDKGARISGFRERLLAELAARDKVDDTCGLLSKLSLSADELEWQKKGGENAKKNVSSAPLDSDDESDDETNPLRIIATHAGTNFHKKQHRVEKPAASLIKQEDIEDDDLADDREAADSSGYVKVLCEKLEKPSELQKRERFRPNRTLRKSLDVVTLPKKPHWEVTAATPPVPVHEEVKLVCLHESFELQKQQAVKLKEVQARHATERLRALAGMRMGSSVPDSAVKGAYREHSDSSGSSEDEAGHEEQEEAEEEPREGDTAVIYSLIDA